MPRTSRAPQRLSRLMLDTLILVLALTLAVPLGTAAKAQSIRGDSTPGQAPRASEAGVVTLQSATIPVGITLMGRALSPNMVQIRPRVGGQITHIHAPAGSKVEAGTPIFTIDPLTWEVALAEAEATLVGAEADLAAARQAYQRAEALRGSGTASIATLETSEASLRRAEASHEEARLRRDLARTQLDWTTLRAPTAGVLGEHRVALGDLVTQNQSEALTTLVQTDPLQIDLAEPWPLRQRLDLRAARGEITLLPMPELELELADGSTASTRSRLLFQDASVSASTGTRRLRFEIANPDGRFSPGMFLHGRLIIGHEEAVLVPQRATRRERDGTLIAWINEDGIARKRSLTEVGTHGAAWAIRSGAAAGESVLVDGIDTLRDGARIKPIAVSIDAMGVVQPATDTPAAATGAQ